MTILIVLSEPGTLDHAIAIKNQLRRSGADIHYTKTIAEMKMPIWALNEMTNIKEANISFHQ